MLLFNGLLGADGVVASVYSYFAIGIKETSGNVRVVPAAMLVLLDEEQAAMESLQESVDDRIAALIGKEELMTALFADKTTERAMERVLYAGILAKNDFNRAVRTHESSTLNFYVFNVAIYRKGRLIGIFLDHILAREESEAIEAARGRYPTIRSVSAVFGKFEQLEK